MGELPFPDPELRDDAVLLRPWNAADVPAIVGACRDISIARWSPVIPFPYEESDALAWLQAQEPTRLAGKGLDLAVVDAATGSVLGAIGLGGGELTSRSANVGYWLARESRGKGYMTRAVRLLARWAFERLALERLELLTDPNNAASQRVAARCGFRREGHLRSHLVVRHSGERRDSLVYGLSPGEIR